MSAVGDTTVNRTKPLVKDKRLRRIRDLSDFPLKLFMRLLKKPDEVVNRFLGANRWSLLKQQWEEQDKSIEGGQLLDQMKKVSLHFCKAHKAVVVLRWLGTAASPEREFVEELGLPWSDDPEELIEYFTLYIEKQQKLYEISLSDLKAMQEKGQQISQSKGTDVDELLASLNLSGFTITDPDAITVGQFNGMTKAIEKENERRKNTG